MSFNKFSLIKLFLYIYFTLSIIHVNSLDCYSTCQECNFPSNLTDQNCIKCKDGYYLNTSTSNCYNCYNSCETCNKNGDIENNNCLNCKTGYYKNESTSNCDACYDSCYNCSIGPNSTSHNCLTCKNGYYFSFGQCYECNSTCKTCSNRATCDSCKSGYYFLNGTKKCVLGSEYANYYISEKKYLIKCDEPCYECSSSYLSEDNQNCLSCIWSYSYDESNNNCKLCENNFITIIKPNFTCDRASDDYCYKYETTCLNINSFNECPYEAPVYIKNNKTCSIGYCNDLEYKEKKCEINNIIFKNQLINNYLQLSSKNYYYFVIVVRNTKNLICITDNYGKHYNQYIFMLNEKGRLSLYDHETQKYVASKFYELPQFYSYRAESIEIKVKENDNFILIVYNYGVVTLNLKGDFINYVNGTNLLIDYSNFYSPKNVLLELKSSNKNEFYYLLGVITKVSEDYYLSLFKFKFLSSDLSNKNNFQLIHKFNNNKLKVKNFLVTATCYQTDNKIIHCLYLDNDNQYNVVIFNEKLKYLDNFNIDDIQKSKSHHKYFIRCTHLKREIGIYFYAGNHLQIKILKKFKKEYNLINYIPLVCDTSIEINHSFYIYDQNDIIKLSDTEFGFVSYAHEIIYIVIFSLYNNDLYLKVRYYSIPTLIYNKIPELKISAINYQNFLGISYGYIERNYNNLNGTYENSSFYSSLIIFSYSNSTDPNSISDFQTLKNIEIKLSDYIQINNNIFGHELYGIKIISVPDNSSGIYLVSLNKKIKLLNGDILNKNDSVIFGYSLNKKIKGNYSIEFAGISTNADYDIMNEYIIEEQHYVDEDFSSYYKKKKFIGRTAQFNISISEQQNIINESTTCEAIILNDVTKCISCKNKNSFVLEDTNICKDNINDDNYYFNKTRMMYMKCHNNCKSCISGPIYEENTYDILINTNCKECKNNFYMIGNTSNCSNENNIDNYFLNESEKKYFKCPSNCKQCELLSNNELKCKKCDDGYQYYEEEKICITCLEYIYFYPYNLSCVDKIKDGDFLTNQTLVYNRKIVGKCHENCLTCKNYPDLINNNMNCESCDNKNNFYFIDGTKNCTNITPFYYYLDTKSKPHIFKKCPENCLRCVYDKIYHNIKCIECDYFKEYYLIYGTNNCSSNITKHYYLDKKNKTYKPCHKSCLSCNSSANLLKFNMNCESCDIDSRFYFIENTKNCTGILPLHYFFDNSTKIFRKCFYKCDSCNIGGNELNMNCASCKNFYKYNSTSLSCIENCPYDYFYYDNNKNLICLNLNELCPENLPFEYTTTKECLSECNTNDLIKKICKVNNPTEKSQEDIISNIINSIKTGSIDSLLPNVTGNSEDIIIKGNNITLQITTTNNQKNNKYNNISIINLGECENVLKNYYNISSNLSLLIFKIEKKNEGLLHPNIQYEVYHPITKEKLDLTICNKIKIIINYEVNINENELFKYDPNDDYYNDVCYKYSKDGGIDITLNDRKSEYLNNNMSLCENNCNFVTYNNLTKKVDCECDVKNSISISDFFSDYKVILDDFMDLKNQMNLNVLKCVKLLFTKDGFLNNIGNFILLFIIIVDIILAFIFYLKGLNYINSIIKNLVLTKKKRKKNLNVNSNNDLLVLKNGNESNNILNRVFSPPLKMSSNDLTKKSDKTPPDNNTNKNFKKRKKKKILTNNISSNDEIIKKKKKAKLKSKKNKVSLIPIENNFNDTELNCLEYKEAIKYDKRTYMQYYWSLLKKKHLLVFSFLPTNDYNSVILKINLFFFTFSLNYTINALFFTDATMHNIYENNGKLNFIYHIPQILYSTLISVIIGIVIKSLCLTEKDILELKKENEYKTLLKQSKKTVKFFKIKILLFFVLTFLLLLVFWYYLSCFCAVYKNTQKILFQDTMTSIGLSYIYPFGLCLLPGIFRIPAINDKKKERECLFKFSKILALI